MWRLARGRPLMVSPMSCYVAFEGLRPASAPRLCCRPRVSHGASTPLLDDMHTCSFSHINLYNRDAYFV